jgi:hypothetical protein
VNNLLATGSETEIKFAFMVSDSSSNFSLDDVSVVQAQTTPEPSSILLFGSGVLGVAGLLRQRLRR